MRNFGKTALRSLSTNATRLIRPSESSKVHAAIYTPKYRGVDNIFLEKAGGPLKKSSNISPNNSSEHPDFFLGEIHEITTEYSEYEYEDKITSVDVESFSQEEWSEFLTHLNPIIVANLRLHNPRYRHLINSYNFCLSNDPIITRNRSSAIGAFPLIAKILAKEKTQNHWQPEAKTGIFSFFDTPESSYTQLIDQGQSTQVLREYFTRQNFGKAPWATDAFLKRMTFAPNLDFVSALGRLLTDASGANEFNEKEFAKIVGNIPFSDRDAAKFKIMQESFQDITREYGLSEAAANLFFNLGNKWDEKKTGRRERVGHGFQDTISEYFENIARDLVLPAYFAELEKRYAARGEAVPASLRSNDKLGYLAVEMEMITKNKLTAFLTVAELESCANRLHRNQDRIDVAKPLFREELEKAGEAGKAQWHALIADQNIDGYEYKVITSRKGLAAEAEKMQNCVRNFDINCMNGKSHIISGKAPDGSDFLMELEKVGEVFLINQIFAPNNEKVSPQIEEDARSMVEKISSGKITSNAEFGSIIKDHNLNDLMGFNLSDKEEVAGVFEAYKKEKVLPDRLQKCALDEFITKTKLDQEINKVIKMVHQDLAIEQPFSVFDKIIAGLSDNSKPKSAVLVEVVKSLFDGGKVKGGR